MVHLDSSLHVVMVKLCVLLTDQWHPGSLLRDVMVQEYPVLVDALDFLVGALLLLADAHHHCLHDDILHLDYHPSHLRDNMIV